MKNIENNKKYCINEEYQQNVTVIFFDDTPFKDEYQNNVYLLAKTIVEDNKYNNILDIGCGSGFKLIKYFNNNNTIGVDLPQTVNWLKQKYPTKKWCTSDNLDKTLKYDMLILSDVIEHVLEPDQLINYILQLNIEDFIISTPDRESLYGPNKLNPPRNMAHIREWTIPEFNSFISKYFKIIKHHSAGTTQIVHCKKYE